MDKLKIAAALVIFLAGASFLASRLGVFPTSLPSLPDFGAGKPMNDALLAERHRYNPQAFSVASGDAVANTFGITRPLSYQGRVIGRPNDENSIYCSGLLLDLYFQAAETTAGPGFKMPGVTASNFRDFRRDWYGFDGNEKTLVNALVSRNLGKEITDPLDAQPGDLIQFWRGRTGHSVLFLGWERDDDGLVVGMRYWSVQNATDGISEHVEFLRGRGGQIDPNRIYIVRALRPNRR